MRARASSRHSASRDFAQGYVLLTCFAICIGIFTLPAFQFKFQLQRDSTPLAAAPPDNPYTGSIIIDTSRRNVCIERKLDNRTGAMHEVGTVSCDAVLSRFSESDQPKGISLVRMRSVASAFRHESE